MERNVPRVQKAIGLSNWPEITQAIKRFGTPLYVYFPELALHAFHVMKKGVAEWGGPSSVAYSLKTNPLLALLKDLNSESAFVEVVSEWEYEWAVRAGFSAERIVLNGPLKPPLVLKRLSNKGLFSINIDSVEELYTLGNESLRSPQPVRVGIRVCPLQLGPRRSRFGLQIDTDEFQSAMLFIKDHPSLQLACIHLHLGTQVTNLDSYENSLMALQTLWEKYQLENDVWLDLGGGFPYHHDRPQDQQNFNPAELFGLLSDRWVLLPHPPLLVEPGRWIAAPSMAIVSRVIASKPRLGEPTVIVLDGGTNLNVMSAFYEHLWMVNETDEEGEFRFCGPLCMEDDILSGLVRGELPKRGSLVVMLNAGAYSFSLSRTFIQPRPPVIRLKRDSSYELLAPREVMGMTYGFSTHSQTT